MTRRLIYPVAALAAAAIAGCGLTNPYASDPHRSSTTTLATTPRPATSNAHADDPSEPAAATTSTAQRSTVTGPGKPTGGTSPRGALERYARLYINWTAKTLGANQRQLAQLSEGTAKAKALQAAASYTRDPLLTGSRVSNRGQIISIAPGQGSEHGSWVIVTSESTTGQGDYSGLPAAAHVTYAQLTHTKYEWLISQWSPQS